MWVTKDKVPTICQYGTTTTLTHNQTGMASVTQGSISTYDVGVIGWKGWIHTVTLTDLTPLTRYYYRVGSAQSGTALAKHRLDFDL